MRSRSIQALVGICALVLLTSSPAWAKFVGILFDAPFSVEVTAAQANNDASAVTVEFVGKGLSTVEAIMTVPAAGGVALRDLPKPGKFVSRIVIEADPCPNGAGILKITQGGNLLEFPFVGDTRFVFDIE